MSDIEERIKGLEVKFGVNEEKEPINLGEFLEQFPDYEELINYISPEEKEILSKFWEVLPRFEGWSDVKIRRAKRCLGYYYKLHPEGIQGVKILEKYGLK